ncbi:MAG TPA: glucoamylase family protein, partial [Pyrinomonadaceae bacterium]|nr:glucoamylase family protein [Pyrinomonadaceae bacterium]
RPLVSERLDRAIERHATEFYIGCLAILTLSVVAGMSVSAYSVAASWVQASVAALLSLIPASDFAISVVNWSITHSFHPRLLPKLNLTKGIPLEASTIVVVPVIVSDETSVREMLEKLEVTYLANQDEHIYWALLGDFADAAQEHTPDDEQIVAAALQGTEELNKRYPSQESPRFYYFHRRRQWCETEGKWICWERKRGKLREFNRWLRGARDTSFTVATADLKVLPQIRYVITLDADTQMPRETACRLIGTALHPLNQPEFNDREGRVVEGYAIFQPRVSISLESASRSTFARIFSGNTGVDPYTTAASDVYQDLFGSGIYTGKGLYDVDAFEQALADRVPDETLLSHDLFESIFARTGLVTDIEFLDDYPTYYDSFARRQHRWTRGDWQIAGWLGRTVRDAHGQKRRNRIPVISRWQILDNLRRSLLAPSIVLLLLAGWTILPGSAWWWGLFVLVTLAFPVYAHVTTGLLIHPRGVPWTSHFWSIWGDLRTNTAQIAIEIVFLAHQAVLMTDAIARTIYRKTISHKHLLEWVTAASSERTSKHDLAEFIRFMLPAEIVVVIGAGLISLTDVVALPVAAIFLFAWLASPFIAFLVSKRRREAEVDLAARDIRASRIVARRTWRFFETFVGDEDHWLPPDNFQEDPKPVVAHRTSPTNIGLLLLSTVAAYDFGYIGLIEMVERLEMTLASTQKLQKFRGHIFNWHDTTTLEPLWPHYVSVVDSGNLAGCLIALKQACLEIPDNRLLDQRILSGLNDTLGALRQELSQLSVARQRTDAIGVKNLTSEIEACGELLKSETPAALPDWLTLVESLNTRAATIDDIAAALSHAHATADLAELRWWSSAFLRQTHNCVRDAKILALVATDADSPARGHVVANVPSLSELTDLDNQGARTANDVSARLGQIAGTCQHLFDEMDFKFLLDEERKVFSIGYNVSEGRSDNAFYDLLATEARVASFVAIAKGDVPQEHWFRMGRQLTSVDGGRALISWTGTMFEYLMPLLVMRDYRDTLLGKTYEAVVSRQIEYGGERGVPWGISESAYAARDLQMNYQYGPFGVPGLGLKRGLIEDLVVSPYSTILASNVRPSEAVENLRALEREGALSRYGLYEALDYTPERVKKGERCTIVHAYMAHHQGMSLVSLDNLLNQKVMQDRFHSDPMVQATELLLQERVPRGVPAAHPRAEEVLTGRVVRILTGLVTRAYDTADLPTPRTQLLSNGNYTVMITTAGGGYSRCGNIAVTRWREDPTRDNWGSFIYVRDVRSGNIWSTGHQPIPAKATNYEVAFSEDKADFWRRDSGIVTHMEAIVSAEDNAELRRITVANFSSRPREIELTSYAEVVLAPQASDVAHPAFSNLFVETEFQGRYNALFARRRPRSSEDKHTWGIHVLASSSETVGGIQFETDRSRFLGRGHAPANAISIVADQPLSNTVGAVLDPIFSLRCRVRLQPNETAQIVFTTGVADSHEHALALSEKYHDAAIFERESRLAWTRAQVEMTHLHIDPEEAHLFQRLAGRILYSDPSLRPTPHVLALNKLSQSRLWAHGISGDLPLVILRLEREEDVPMAKQLLRAHQYLRSKGLQFDLLILNDHPSGYAQSLQDSLQTAARTSGAQALIDKTGGVFIRRSDQVPEDERILLHAVARLVIVSERGSLEDQLVRRPAEEPLPPDFQPRAASQIYTETPLEIPKLTFFNGVGGFAHGG